MVKVRIGFKLGYSQGWVREFVGMVRVRMHYIYESHHKDRSTRICVRVFVCLQ